MSGGRYLAVDEARRNCTQYAYERFIRRIYCRVKLDYAAESFEWLRHEREKGPDGF